jgi:hypothetical protein
MMHSNKRIVAAVFSSLLVVHNWNAVHAAAGPLDGIDSQLIYNNFRLESITDVSEETNASVIPGCAQVKSFQVVEGAPGSLIVAICREGDFGPGNIEATVARQVAQAKEALKTLPPHVATFMLSGIEAVEVPLDAGSRGKALTIPAIGHGFVMLPLAYAVTTREDMAIFVQAYLDPNNPRNLNVPMAALLKAVHQRVALQVKPPGT